MVCTSRPGMGPGRACFRTSTFAFSAISRCFRAQGERGRGKERGRRREREREMESKGGSLREGQREREGGIEGVRQEERE
jgi:hypothetical protein